MTAKDESEAYKRGLLEGKIVAMEQMSALHSDRLDKHEARLRTLEKSAYLLIGAITIMQFAPEIKAFFT